MAETKRKVLIQKVLFTALMTGFFCAILSFGIDWLTDMLARTGVVMISFISGFFGSVFASIVRGDWSGR